MLAYQMVCKRYNVEYCEGREARCNISRRLSCDVMLTLHKILVLQMCDINVINNERLFKGSITGLDMRLVRGAMLVWQRKVRW